MSGLTFQDNNHIITKKGDNYINFQAARQDQSSSATKRYEAWLSAEEGHIIMERDLADTTDITMKYFYDSDNSNFQVNWDARAAKTYVDYNALFTG